MRDNEYLVIVSLLSLVLLTLAIGFNEIFVRLRPRVIYVYRNDDSGDDIPVYGERVPERTTAADSTSLRGYADNLLRTGAGANARRASTAHSSKDGNTETGKVRVQPKGDMC